MKVITGTRGCGVTSQLLSDALYSKNAVCICATKASAKYMEGMKTSTKDIKYTTLKDIASGNMRGIRDADIYIDDIQSCLELFLHTYGVTGKIKYISATW